MFLRLFATFLVTLFFGVGNSVKEVPQRILQPHCANYIIEREDNVVTGGYYTLSSEDNPLTYFFGYQNLSWSTANPNNLSSFYISFFTYFEEGIVGYDYSLGNRYLYDSFMTLDSFLYEYWTGLDFFTFDLLRMEVSNNIYYITGWSRYYGIGEQKIGTTCYFEDNIAFSFNSSLVADSVWHVLDLPNYSTIMESQLDDLSFSFRITDSSIFYKRDYTETKPNSLSFAFNETSPILSESFLYSFHFESFFQSSNRTFTSNPFSTDYRFVFGFTYPNNQTFNSGYQEGYSKGYDEGTSEGYQNGYDEGYDLGYDNAKDDYYDTRYTEGYNQGVYDESQLSNKYTFANLFGALADTPIMILRSLLGFEVFGVEAIAILMSMITAVIALYIIRRIIF